MEYNKRQYNKTNNKKVLHKVRKHWVVLSMALLSAIGGGAAVTHAEAHADTNTDNQSASNQTNRSQADGPQVKMTSNASQSNSVNANMPSAKSIMNQAGNLHQHILLGATNQTDGRQVETKVKQSSTSVAQKASDSKSSVNSNLVHQQVDALKEAKSSKKGKLGVQEGKIFIHYVVPEQNYIHVKGTSDTTAGAVNTTIPKGTLSQFLTIIPQGYVKPRFDLNLEPNHKLPTVYTAANQDVYIDVTPQQNVGKGFIEIKYLNAKQGNEEENHQYDADQDGALVQYSDIVGDLLTPPTVDGVQYDILNYKYYNANDPAHPTKPGKYLGGVDPNKFPLKYTSDVTPIDVEVVPSDSSDASTQMGAPIYIDYINQHGVDVDTPAEDHGFNGLVGSTLNATVTAPIPRGYQLDNPSHAMSFNFQTTVQHEVIQVDGKAITPQDVTINRMANDGKPLSSVNIPISGHVGDTYGIDPNSSQLLPTGYYADSHNNKKVTGIILPPTASDANPSLSKPQFTFIYDTKPDQNSAAPIHFNYINQNGQNVNTISDDTSISGPIGSKIKPSDKAPVPNGYVINPKQRSDTYPITNYEQTIPVFVNGKAVSDSVTITRSEQTIGKNGQPIGPATPLNANVSDRVYGEVGNTGIINPSDFDPAGDDAANSDFANDQITFNPNGVTPKTKNFVYNKSYNGKSMSDISNQVSGTVVLEDQDNNDNHIGQFTVKGTLGQLVNYGSSDNMNNMRNIVPSDSTQYYLVNKNAKQSDLPFAPDPEYPNAVMYNGGTYPVMVGEYGNINLFFTSSDGGSLQSDRLKQPKNSSFDALKAVSDFMSQNGNDTKYEVKNVTVKDDITNQSKQYSVKDLQSNPNAILYGKDLQDVTFTMEAKPQKVTATITYKDDTNSDTTVDKDKPVTVSGMTGTQIPYQQNVPRGYKFEKLASDSAKNFSTNPSDQHVAYVGQLVTDKIIFEDEDKKNQQVGTPIVITDVKNTPINYQDYENKIPSDLVFDKGSQKNPTMQPNAIYTMYVKTPASDDVPTSITLEDETANKVLSGDTITVYGVSGQTVPESAWINKLPSNYKYDETNPENLPLKSLTYGGKSGLMYVKHSPVTETINFKDENTRQPVPGSDSVTGEPGQTIDLSKQKVPSDYTYDSSQNTNPTYGFSDATYTMMIKHNPVTDTINFEDENTKQPVPGSDSVTGEPGQTVDLSKLKVPSNYAYDPSQNTNPTYGSSNATYTMMIKHNPVTDKITFMDETTHLPVPGSDNVSGEPGQTVDLSDIKVPSNYTYDPSQNTKPTYGSSDSTYTMNVQHVPVTETILFKNDKSKQLLSDQYQFQGIPGSTISLDKYSGDVPAGYVFDKNNNPASTTLSTNGNNIYTMNVKPATITATINFEDETTHTPVKGQITASGTSSDDTLDFSKYSDQVPNGYMYDPNNNPVVKHMANKQTYTMNVEPSEVTGTVTLVDETTQKPLQGAAPAVVTGTPGKLVDFSKVNVPAGYEYDPQATAKAKYSYKGSYTMMVKPVEVSGKLFFQDADTGTVLPNTYLIISGKPGQAVDFKEYSGQVPNGYEYDAKATPSTKFSANSTYTMMVLPSKVTGTITFEDETTKLPIKVIPVVDKPDSTINFDDFKSLVPGYEFDPRDPSSAKLTANGQYTILVKPVNNQAAAVIQYKDAETGQVLRTVNINGKAGAVIPYDRYEDESESYMPTGYHFYKLGQNDSQLKNGDVDVILVEKNGSTQPSKPTIIEVPTNNNGSNKTNQKSAAPASATEDIVYLTPSDNVIADRTVTGQVGMPVNYYAYVPAGYQVIGNISGNQKFQTNGRAYVYVNKIAKPTTTPTTKPAKPTKQKPSSQPVAHHKHITHQTTLPKSQSHGSSILKNRIAKATTANAGTRTNQFTNGQAGRSQTGSVEANDNASSFMSGISAPQMGDYNAGISQQPSGKLPQTGEKADHAKEIAVALMALSAGIDALGVLDRRRHGDE